MTVFTIGYEGLDMDTFLSLLKENYIETVVDVREMPLSRKPGFSKKSLEITLKYLGGMDYVHMPALGCPRRVRERYRRDGDWQRYTADFMAYLETQDEAIAELSEMVSSSSCALLCYEADANFCHRSMVADAVHDYCGANVEHLAPLGTRTAPPARLQMEMALAA